MSFMLENLEKPVILTGSQLPIGMIRTDGKENLITSIEIAAASVNGKAVPEVCIYFENKLLRGNRVCPPYEAIPIEVSTLVLFLVQSSVGKRMLCQRRGC